MKRGFVMRKQIEQTLTSLEVAEMINKNHADLMRDIRRYTKQLAQSKIAFGDFFQESIYKDVNSQERPCYKITKKGCEFVAHKLTGIKGTIFTAKYINRFHNLESIILQKENNSVSAVSFKEQVECIKIIAEDLHVNEVSKLVMYQKLCESNHVPTDFLPDYTVGDSREKKTATELLKQFQFPLSANKFNQLLVKAGILEERERTSSTGKNGKKKFKALTEKGLEYGENLVSKYNTKEIQPYYYVDTFCGLYNLVREDKNAPN